MLKFGDIGEEAWRDIATNIEAFGKYVGEMPVLFRWAEGGGVAILRADKPADGAHPCHDGKLVAGEGVVVYGPITFADILKVKSELEAVADFIGKGGKVRETKLDLDGIHIDTEGLSEFIELSLWDGKVIALGDKMPTFGNSLAQQGPLHKRPMSAPSVGHQTREVGLGRPNPYSGVFAPQRSAGSETVE